MGVDRKLNQLIKKSYFPEKNGKRVTYARVPFVWMKHLSSSEALLLAVIMDTMGNNNYKPWSCWKSHHTLGESIGLSRPSSTQIAKKLRSKGLLSWTRTGKSNDYQLERKLLELIETDVEILTSEVGMLPSDVSRPSSDVGKVEQTNTIKPKLTNPEKGTKTASDSLSTWVEGLDYACRWAYVDLDLDLKLYPALPKSDVKRISSLISSYSQNNDLKTGVEYLLTAICKAWEMYHKKPTDWYLPNSKDLLVERKIRGLITGVRPDSESWITIKTCDATEFRDKWKSLIE